LRCPAEYAALKGSVKHNRCRRMITPTRARADEPGSYVRLSMHLASAEPGLTEVRSTVTTPRSLTANSVVYHPPRVTGAPTSSTPPWTRPASASLSSHRLPPYFANVTATERCLENWKNLIGVWPNRIGGTTQDQTTYDPVTSAYVAYIVASPAEAPRTVTFGPRFTTLSGMYQGSVVIGLN
jgi:hypothetical protein